MACLLLFYTIIYIFANNYTKQVTKMSDKTTGGYAMLEEQEFGCERSRNAHVERKKSKISYILESKPDRHAERDIERRMNELIEADLPVTMEFVTRDNLPDDISLERLPADAPDTVRIVRIGNYDACACIGKHVRSTSQIGRFEMLGTNWDEHTHTFRIRFKIVT